jgi:hypothetical protein
VIQSYWLDDHGFDYRLGQDMSLLPTVQTGTVANPASYSMDDEVPSAEGG